MNLDPNSGRFHHRIFCFFAPENILSVPSVCSSFPPEHTFQLPTLYGANEDSEGRKQRGHSEATELEREVHDSRLTAKDPIKSKACFRHLASWSIVRSIDRPTDRQNEQTKERRAKTLLRSSLPVNGQSEYLLSKTIIRSSVARRSVESCLPSVRNSISCISVADCRAVNKLIVRDNPTRKRDGETPADPCSSPTGVSRLQCQWFAECSQ